MSSLVRVVCRPETALGLALAGVPTARASTPREGAELIVELASRPDIGVLLVEDVFYDALSDTAKRALERRPVPITVPFPGPSWTESAEEAEAHLVEILSRAIGYRVRLR
ncbi:MAG TPA: V-type ATP synthase subunit F [Vicinamibacteria bacterium]|nr:V-type ATP synthase subunit F [Vicinamibacteria bacterium]